MLYSLLCRQHLSKCFKGSLCAALLGCSAHCCGMSSSNSLPAADQHLLQQQTAHLVQSFLAAGMATGAHNRQTAAPGCESGVAQGHPAHAVVTPGVTGAGATGRDLEFGKPHPWRLVLLNRGFTAHWQACLLDIARTGCCWAACNGVPDLPKLQST